ncbi:Sodium/hydrogen exchanger 1-like protein [Drosera capensis]
MSVLENFGLSASFSLQSSSIFNTETVIAITLFMFLLCACIVIGHLLEENRWANESITALLLGLASGGIVLLVKKGYSSKLLVFNEELFFIYLLPPIIFNAGFQVKKKQFFKNFSTILLFGVLGTVISFCLISLGGFLLLKKIGVTSLDVQDYVAIGAIFSATDSVCTLQVLSQEETPFLYSVVFGEGVVNDATSIVLFNAVQKLDLSDASAMTALSLLGTFLYLLFTSTVLGVVVGLLSAYIIKTLYIGRHSTDREIAIMMLLAYMSYLVAELLSLSGILTVFFCGIVMSHYTWHNISESSRLTTKHSFATISFIAETFIFLYVGMDALDIDKWKKSEASAGTILAVSSTFLALVLIGRAAFVFPLANLSNYMKKREAQKMGWNRQFIAWWAGLMRGAVTVALSYNEFTDSGESSSSMHSLMITCTIVVVLFSTLVFGSVTKPLVEALLGRHARQGASDVSATDITSLEDLRILFMENRDQRENGGGDDTNQRPRGGGFRLMMRHPTWTAHHLWRKFDDKFMRPVFGGRGFVPYEPSSPTGAADPSHEHYESEEQ